MSINITLKPIQYIQGNILLPGSKSISNRVLLIASLSNGITNIQNLLKSDDICYMLQALKLLGVNYQLNKNNTVCNIIGINGIFHINNNLLTLFLGNAGTAMRPLLAVLSLLKTSQIILTGDNRMKERPIKDLVDSLRQGGALIKYQEKNNYPPVIINGGYIGGEITVNGTISSQFLTALLIAAPLAKNVTIINIKGKLVSQPYIDITLNILKSFGVKIINNQYKNFFINGNQQYISPHNFFVEGDASSASYFLAAAAIKGGTVCVEGIDKNSIQGDIHFANVLQKMGAIIKWGKNCIICTKNKLTGIDIDLNHIPDAAMTIAIVALFANGKTTIRNIYNWRLKESDRITAMATEMRKIGAIIEEGKDFISIQPPKIFYPAIIETYNDHRIAMCFSLITLSGVPITIVNPNCVNKTFPEFFVKLDSISHYY
ncbi:3-phosphoshikimate 1-carboxyvinyltransferase [Buchnera aphidicola (Thelaxes suberi)]|uniref:3-phosphoshikimate 1-carboxyvinyltransferase n=1 Tax=Buchnera aphidicola TaxID=9 RepID=UPI003463CD47